MRSGSANQLYPNKKDPTDGRKLCAWCETRLPFRKQRYCSRECLDEIWIRTNPGHARSKVYDRDQGVCANCGTDTQRFKKLLREWPRVSYHFKSKALDALAEQFALAGISTRRKIGSYSRFGHTWEMNHITPVADGGGLCGLENLETLCLPCHRKETAAQAASRAAKARLEKGLATQLKIFSAGE